MFFFILIHLYYTFFCWFFAFIFLPFFFIFSKTKDSNEFYVSTLEVAEAKRKDHPQDKIQPFLIHNPSNVTVLNGYGTAEVIAVTHDHGISIVAIDVKSSVVLGCQSVAGRTRRQQEENVASEKLKRSQSASSTETKKPRPMFKSKSAVTATKLSFGYVDGVPSKSKFHLPTGILLGKSKGIFNFFFFFIYFFLFLFFLFY